jgi:hypothetical protein
MVKLLSAALLLAAALIALGPNRPAAAEPPSPCFELGGFAACQ